VEEVFTVGFTSDVSTDEIRDHFCEILAHCIELADRAFVREEPAPHAKRVRVFRAKIANGRLAQVKYSAIRSYVASEVLPLDELAGPGGPLLVKHFVPCVETNTPATRASGRLLLPKHRALLMKRVPHSVGSIRDVPDEPTHCSNRSSEECE
jgi:hypothetical protein